VVRKEWKERNNGKYINISSIDIEGSSSRLVYIEDYKKPLRFIKQVVAVPFGICMKYGCHINMNV